MSNLNPNKPTVPLTIGNVVSAGLRIYRDRFQLYYGLGLRAYLWILLPVYGWAKFASISGLISRLAFAEVRETPETLEEAHRYIQPRMWNFFLAGLLVSLILFGATVGGIIVIGIVTMIVGDIFGAIAQDNPLVIAIVVLLAIVAFFVFVFGYVWLFSRLSIVELPIAVEDQGEPPAAIRRSWNLTKGAVVRLQGIFFVAFLLTLPISIVVNIVSQVIQLLFALVMSSDSSSPLFTLVYFLIIIGLAIASGALFVPFWQIIKAVIYYDLRSRKEGLGLQIRDPY